MCPSSESSWIAASLGMNEVAGTYLENGAGLTKITEKACTHGSYTPISFWPYSYNWEFWIHIASEIIRMKQVFPGLINI